MGQPVDPAPDRAPDAAVVAGPTADDAATPGVDVGRRSFFRRMAGELVQTAATLTGVATVAHGAVEGASAAARELAAGTPPVAAVPGGHPDQALREAVREAVRPWIADEDHGRRLVLDQRRLPGTVATFPVASAAAAARAIKERVVSGPSAAMLAAWALARTMEDAEDRTEGARAALVTGAERSLLAADAGSHVLRWAIGTLQAAIATGVAPGAAADALHARVRDEHDCLAEAAAAVLGPASDDSPAPVLLHGPGGYLWAAGADVTVSAALPGPIAVTEARPWLDGARILAWELARRGVVHTLMTDAAAVGAVARGEVRAVLCMAERVAGDQSVSLPVGAMGLAVAAAYARVPFLVVAAPWAMDSVGAPDAASLTEPPAPSAAVARAAGVVVAPPGSVIDATRFEVVPASLVTQLVVVATPS